MVLLLLVPLVAALLVDKKGLGCLVTETMPAKMGLQKGKEIFREILLDAKGSVCLLLQFSLGKKYKVFQEA